MQLNKLYASIGLTILSSLCFIKFAIGDSINSSKPICHEIANYAKLHHLGSTTAIDMVDSNLCSQRTVQEWNCVYSGIKNGNNLNYSMQMCFYFKNPEIYKNADKIAQKYCLESIKYSPLSGMTNLCNPETIERSPSQFKCLYTAIVNGNNYAAASNECFSEKS
ncbi:MAG: hypothetical protein O2809_11515 [Proteobacteria bacterium]|nr:hypothetical protein [Pseudomonadota bacterium]